MFFNLARHPEVYAKLREEVGRLDGRLPTSEDLREMKYLMWCINEGKQFPLQKLCELTQTALRLFPSVPANTHEAVRDTVLPRGGGPDEMSPLFVVEGTQVYYSTWTIHRRAEFFGENP